MTPLLDARQVKLAGRLLPLDLTSKGGELIALVGPNGGGKTSLLRAFARVDGASGSVRIDGESIDEAPEARRRRLLSFLPASREVAWPICVRDVIALGLGARDPREIDAQITAFGLKSLADRPINSLSTGERARALLARALVAEPRLLLLDEPLSNLDPYWVLRTLDVLAEAVRGGVTILLALHDIALIGRFDRLLLLTGGRIIADGFPASLHDQVGTLFGVEPAPNGGWQLAGS